MQNLGLGLKSRGGKRIGTGYGRIGTMCGVTAHLSGVLNSFPATGSGVDPERFTLGGKHVRQHPSSRGQRP